MRARVFVVAPTHREARQVARELGYRPYSREVKLISRAVQVRGHSLTADDHVVWSGRSMAWRAGQADSLVENLRIAACTSPEPVSQDWWGR